MKLKTKLNIGCALLALLVNGNVAHALYQTTATLDTITVDVEAEHLFTFGSASSNGGVTLQVDDLPLGAQQVSTISNAQQAGQWIWGYDDGQGSFLTQMHLDANDNLWLGGARVLTTADGVLTGDQISSGSGPFSLSFGNIATNTASGVRSSAFGVHNIASGNDSAAQGVRNIASGHYSQAQGFESEATGAHSFASGQKSTANGVYSSARGVEVDVSDRFSFGFGQFTDVAGDFSFAFGLNNHVNANFATAFGESNVVLSDYSFAAGDSLRVNAYGASAFGRYNESFGSQNSWGWNDILFTVGNGESVSSRSNALQIRKNGHTVIKNRFWDPANRLVLPADPDPNTPVDEGSAGQALAVLGHTGLHGNLNVRGNALFQGQARIAGLRVDHNATIKSDITMERDALVEGNLHVVGSLSLEQAQVHVAGSLNLLQPQGDIPMFQP